MAASLWWDDPQTSNNKCDQKNTVDELLVFGYACKLFRDDEKALDIDKGKLLIPWMGDERLMIDRYDGRGHLYDLATHDSENVDKNPPLTEEEQAVEKACDEERYLELHTDVREAQIYEEEEWKRYYLSLQEGYKAVGFSYDEQFNMGQEEVTFTEPVKEEDEKPFVPPAELQLPKDMHIPSCVKQNARIEKTANFIAQHGIQMEIMLKTKQAGNQQFDFLHFEDELNPYYKHVVQMIKSGKYKPAEEDDDNKKETEEDDGHSYLHPSLSSTSLLPPPPPPPSKPIELPKVSIHDTPYGALIKSIQENTEISRLSSLKNQAHTYHQATYDADYQTQMMSMYHNNPPPPGTETVTLPMVSSLSGQALVDQLYSQPLPPGTEEQHDGSHPSLNRKDRRRRTHSSDSSSSSSSGSSSKNPRSSKQNSISLKDKNSSKVPARAEGPNLIEAPPPDVEPIIDRMAMYVAKNGAEFEMVVMSRNDPRFQFLNEFHAHHPYYKKKKEKYIQELNKTSTETNEVESLEDKSGQNLQRSVSFSIKPRPKDQEGSQQPGKPWLFEYDSSEGEEEKLREQVSENLSGSVTPTAKPPADEDTQKEIEEKLKDKLASAMKERISQSHKEKQLQMERKRKAAMFLNTIKTSQPSLPLPSNLSEEAVALYIGEGPANPVVFEYDNQSMPQMISSSHSDRASSSSRSKKRRKRSPTPPSAYNLEKRSPNRPSPPRWPIRPAPWASLRERTPPWQRRNREMAFRRSRSRSPHWRDDKRKKYRRSKSRSPTRGDRNKEKSRHSKEKHKSREREKEKKNKERSRPKSKDRDSSRASKNEGANSGDESSCSDVEILDKSPEPRAFKNGSVPIISAEALKKIKGVVKSESADDLVSSVSRTTSQENSPAPLANTSRGSTPSRSSTEATSTASSDLMSKVRAMLKKSREMIRKEEGFSLEDT
ncbi:hypothetical protein Btru_002516 [Bulinus truncatus]|nr:hypothetical protein Btru_002516 [Bulinus truncatus]